MQVQELHGELYYALVSPEGDIMLMTLSPTEVGCGTLVKMMHKAGLIQSFHELFKVKGFKILPVTLSLEAWKSDKIPT